MNVFQIFNFGSAILDILHKCCCNTRFLQYLSRKSFISCSSSIILGSISSTYESFEEIHIYTDPLTPLGKLSGIWEAIL